MTRTDPGDKQKKGPGLRELADSLRSWIQHGCDEGSYETPTARLFESYLDWCGNSRPPIQSTDSKTFGRGLTVLGYGFVRTGRERWRKGLRLKAARQSAPPPAAESHLAPSVGVTRQKLPILIDAAGSPVEPEGLGEAALRIWRFAVDELGVKEPSRLSILFTACAHWEISALAARTATDEGVIVANARGRSIPHPALEVAKEFGKSSAGLMEKLGLHLEPEDDG